MIGRISFEMFLKSSVSLSSKPFEFLVDSGKTISGARKFYRNEFVSESRMKVIP